MASVPINIEENGRVVTGEADPISRDKVAGIPQEFVITIDGKYMGVLSYGDEGWSMNYPLDPDLVETLGEYLIDWYE